MRQHTQGVLPKKYFGQYKKPLVETPNLVIAQLDSFKWIISEGIKEVFDEFKTITDYTGKKFELSFLSFELGKPKVNEHFAKDNKLSYDAPLKAQVKLKNFSTGSEKEQEVFLADFPMMTDHGTFIISGVERVIVPQLARSFGAFFTVLDIRGKNYFGAKIIPSRGVWIEIETEADGVIYVRIDRKRKFPLTLLFRAFGLSSDEEILKHFKDSPAIDYIKETLAKDTTKSSEDAYVEIYRRLRDGDLATVENAKEFFESMISPERYDLTKVGRFQINNRFSKPTGAKELAQTTLSIDDLTTITNRIGELNVTPHAQPDDIDHLGSRRVRLIGELLQQKVRIGMARMKRNIQNRMSTVESDITLPIQFVNPKPLQAQIKEFYATNQLSQFMDQTNVLSELEHKRRLSALGPGGLSRTRAGFEVRDVHPSHYGRVCPVHTPEGQNIGLILHLSAYARINDFGMIETPYAKVKDGVVTSEIIYVNALEEENYKIAHAATDIDEKGKILSAEVDARINGEPTVISAKEVDLIDIATNQIFSVATGMIPFLNHDDANRALMGSNMQKQAVPCIIPEAPLVATGIERDAARDTGRVVLAQNAGDVTYADARKVIVKESGGKERTYDLVNFSRTNGFTIFHQRPAVKTEDKVKRGDVLADTSTSVGGEMSIGQNIRVAFLSWTGANYEDAIIVSERLVSESKFTSIHIEEFVINVRDTKLGPEVTTCDIPNVSENKLKNLDEEGVIRVGAEVHPGDILVGKITPKGETQLTPEERLLRSLFGEKARDVKDTSKRMEGGKKGRIVKVQVFSREKGDKLESGILKRIHIEVAELRNVSVGDKLAGRHGNKGVISRILPVEDMPYMDDGTPIDIILTPLGVPSRMNLGQILEMHLGLAAGTLGYQAIVPPFAGATGEEIQHELEQAGFPADGKVKLYDGRTGEAFEQKVAIGEMYILKLHHMVDDKIHMRSIGPYSLITQQPLGGKAQNGGQRFGEMEVWALLGYGAAYTLREMLTVKSDDIVGRSAAFDSIVRGDNIEQTNIPASFNVLLYNLRGLALDVALEKREEEQVEETN
ncbi:MAG: DNA-directed RNA polymerase subunit beta [Candidatus Zambryskibacteria bacterium CG10_big_fil_rev_8_21_14_0_10_42_12]|uniref:DNA-directed RNA polymerase subunit beta n=1 Tax=Candidatus Zambryskibacteria bacterium CG10_big_fil_rev_8_21_14_0_10_42_12 TaxID=1975115 RepID=A0A2H0QVU4_9BACT|nr:MAG: DNA-directed RNA polymerase subunit beta [Candidatus Zambryskibacteria bacterium CG10_big_fil_rev_8_21_14_0_10_42_12]